MKYPRRDEVLLTSADVAAQDQIHELRRQLEEKEREIQHLKMKTQDQKAKIKKLQEQLLATKRPASDA